MALENEFIAISPITEANCDQSHSDSGSKTAHFMSNSTLNMKNETPLVTVPSRSSLRKHAFYGILALVTLLGLGITQSAKANLILNPGFETGDFTDWTAANGSVVGTYNGFVAPHSGNYQAAFGQGAGGLSQNVTTTPGASYVVDFWVAGIGLGVPPGGLMGTLLVSWGGANVLSLVAGSGFAYTHYTFDVNASSATTGLSFVLTPNFQSSFLLDDISVNPASVPDAGSTLPLLSFALLGVAVLRRKLRCQGIERGAAFRGEESPS